MSILQGKRILVTRALTQNTELVQKLESRGAIALIYPCLEIAFLPFELPDIAFNWVIYTSQNAVMALSGYSLPGVKIATVGERTARHCEELQAMRQSTYSGLLRDARNDESTLTPLTYNSESLAKLFKNKPPQKILLPQGDLADSSLKEALEKSGHEVIRVIVYSTRKPANSAKFDFGHLDAITFTSPSAAKNFLELTVAPTHPAFAKATAGTVACIGTTTYQAAQALGFKQVICAQKYSMEGLTAALEQHFCIRALA